MLDLYKNIKQRRKMLKLSQEELALMVGYSDRSSIAKIESGKVDLQQSKILEFAKALETTPAALMGWDKNFEPKDKKVLSCKEENLIRNYNNTSSIGKEKILNNSKDMTIAYPTREVMLDFISKSGISIDEKISSLNDAELTEYYIKIRNNKLF